jgi:site-specific DNA-methyltransferase (adenine-specific)
MAEKVTIGNCELYCGDCLEVMRGMASGSVDAIICDLPYGTTACKWDTVIPFEPLWAQYKRIAKPNAAIVLTASQPFTTALIASNMREFQYCWVWDKRITTGFAFAKFQPMRAHEDVCVFGGRSYNPQMVERSADELKRFSIVASCRDGGEHYSSMVISSPTREGNKLKSPNSVIRITGVVGRSGEKVAHPTQKPIALMEYLIRTYTNEGETVLDNCMGSGTTGVACKNLGRNFVGIELEQKYLDIACRRIEQAYAQPRLFDEPKQNPTQGVIL